MIGLGVMGRNFLLNIAGQGFSAAAYVREREKLQELEKDLKDLPAAATSDLKEFAGLLRRPRAIIMLVPAGRPVDDVIGDLAPLLEKDDLIIDAGNSHYADTERRFQALAAKSLKFMGLGISGGEEGARRGASIMAGGDRAAYERIRPVLEAAAAKVGGEPCAAWLGPGSAGHFVKMVHNGIEYAFMQLIAESYDLMKRGLGLNDEELRVVYAGWNKGELNSYLVEITSAIFSRMDPKTGKVLINEILDVAGQKGTGMWASRSAMELQVPVPTIDAAVAMRDLSRYEAERAAAARLLGGGARQIAGGREENIDRLHNALYAALLLTYVQGMALLFAASRKHGYALNPETITGVWRGGCIIRSAMLEDIRAAYSCEPGLANLLLAPAISEKLLALQGDLRSIVSSAALSGVPVPALMSALGYLDAYRSGWLPANLIQAQRDYFGAHTYERNDAEGVFHTAWKKSRD
jgi:6-phosphogluconate dehydrogenase